jgi:hypothetical protein
MKEGEMLLGYDYCVTAFRITGCYSYFVYVYVFKNRLLLK